MAKRQTGARMVGMILVALVVSGCRDSRDPSPAAANGAVKATISTLNAPIAVTSSYLEAAVRDIRLQEVPLVRLAGPSMCPGHFDMRPSQISDLARCRLLVRFDFQRSLDEKLSDQTKLSILSVALPGGICVPDTYLEVCRQIADHFVSAGEMERPAAERRLDEIANRMTTLTDTVRRKINATGLRGAPVLTSGHQAAFCQWLGLRPVATFSGGDTAGTGEIDQAVKAGQSADVTIIGANEPEGRRLADALADRLHARVVVFANFPEPDKESAFDNMVFGNLTALLEAGLSGEKEP
jgi:zinc transport system substrate-binding protein